MNSYSTDGGDAWDALILNIRHQFHSFFLSFLFFSIGECSKQNKKICGFRHLILIELYFQSTFNSIKQKSHRKNRFYSFFFFQPPIHLINPHTLFARDSHHQVAFIIGFATHLEKVQIYRNVIFSCQIYTIALHQFFIDDKKIGCISFSTITQKISHIFLLVDKTEGVDLTIQMTSLLISILFLCVNCR